MGLLDDAIREHLELKRLTGADPVEVARKQREALAPLDRDKATHAESQETHGNAGSARSAPGSDGLSDGRSANGSRHPQAADLAVIDQETAELDMQTLLDEGNEAISDRTSAAGTSSGQASEEDSLEWEMPSRGAGDSRAEPDERSRATGLRSDAPSAGEHGHLEESARNP
jgi:hypothetical protein